MINSPDKQRKSAKSFKVDIKKFKTIKELRSGAFASINLVQDIRTKNIYAAKISKFLNNDEDEQTKTMINREIGIMMLFQHPSIIKFYGYSNTDMKGIPRFTILMDYAKNGSLYDALAKARDGFAVDNYDNTARQIILTGIARGMMFLHQHNVIHRDLKTGNILLDENFHPYITDFGLSKIYESGQEMFQSQSVGTSYYMAPEVIKGRRYNGKADVYSYGIIMYEVLTETIPYPLLENGKLSLLDFHKKVLYENYRPQFTVPIKKSFRHLIERCWSSDPIERPTFEEIFNKLAFNSGCSIYDDYEDTESCDDDESKYHLDDLEIDDFLCYIDEIVESDIKGDKSASKATINNLRKDANRFKNDIDSFQNDMDKLHQRLTNLQQQFTENFDEQASINEKKEKSLKGIEKDINVLKKQIHD